MQHPHKALALFSGGLDSLLSVLYMRKLGYEVIPIFFRTPFFTEVRAVNTARANGFEIEVIDITDVHVEMLHNPVYGFGKNFNPCIDCHGLMFKTAGNLLQHYGAHFLISGEVLSQRPMSQRKDAMNAVGKLSGFRDLLIRPLSQKLLDDTLPVREGWIAKEEMLDLSGRSRKPQMALAKELGVVTYPSPAGGCLLTDVNFSFRLRELMAHALLAHDDIHLLRYGRHFRLSETVKFIVGREAQDNDGMLSLNVADLYFLIEHIPGPLGILKGSKITEDDIRLAAAILAYYNKKADDHCIAIYGTQSAALSGDADITIPGGTRLQTTKADFETVMQYMIQEHK